jgi:hypothetical protein
VRNVYCVIGWRGITRIWNTHAPVDGIVVVEDFVAKDRPLSAVLVPLPFSQIVTQPGSEARLSVHSIAPYYAGGIYSMGDGG